MGKGDRHSIIVIDCHVANTSAPRQSSPLSSFKIVLEQLTPSNVDPELKVSLSLSLLIAFVSDLYVSEC